MFHYSNELVTLSWTCHQHPTKRVNQTHKSCSYVNKLTRDDIVNYNTRRPICIYLPFYHIYGYQGALVSKLMCQTV